MYRRCWGLFFKVKAPWRQLQLIASKSRQPAQYSHALEIANGTVVKGRVPLVKTVLL